MSNYQARWNGVVLAESEHTIEVEGNQYFPPASLNREYFKESSTTSRCPWKGEANYYTLEAGGASNQDAAWHYPHPLHAAENIKGHVAFWHGVEVAKVVAGDGDAVAVTA
ncbi:hypothetical protein AOC05_08560 [Arthrobacter alpinus]|uniref:DUF427 domain-containing protein n=1 Tax=Arthrobacter alpinus TaxID=656366 RepID=A0A0M3UG93_9MICC|nr:MULTISPECIES: DUF427 domain-containing protein [Arthrobacter]ALE92359.1 hypothetical protein AOC05_08560 [Arthrobacter alpinus]